KPKSDNIKMPVGMSADAKKHWKQVSKQLKEAGILTNLDITALMIYCETYAQWKDATDKISTHGAVVKGKDGYPIRSPYLYVAQKGFEQMKSMLTEFGMTPSSRTKVNTTDDHQKQQDPWADL
ncbi:MAG: phage terminase small subunit P27 family, partial [Gammaproteobacteria bacterium]|nr:phage terminase small subunit P27 family [Gammaproteobacteria bacterium]